MMRFTITGVGLCSPGISSWNDFLEGAREEFTDLPERPVAPSPMSIPAKERRRAPLPVKLAIEVIEQACEMAGAEKDSIATVFTSAMGDTAITDYMCRTLTGPNKLLSPTRFHNSVHNAPSGYWSIAAGNRTASGYVGGFMNSFSVALLEAAVLGTSANRPVVLAAYDVAHARPLDDICRTEESFGMALLLDPSSDAKGWRIGISCEDGGVDSPSPRNPFLRDLSERNPAARSLSLLEAIIAKQADSLCWPLGTATHLRVTLEP